MDYLPYGRQVIDEQDVQAVVDVLRSDFLTQGPTVPLFERAIAERCGAKYAIAANSATSALHMACLALGLGPGDWLWTSPISFVASANCALYCGAKVDFVDIDPRTYCLDASSLEAKLVQAEAKGVLPKVVVPIHFAGQPCDMAAVHGLSLRYGFKIIEDASHAIGSTSGGQPIGTSQYSDITIFSFHPVKIITTAEGGVAATNQEHLASAMRLLRSHGITRDPGEMTRSPDGPWYYQQVLLGFNYRMTDVHAALGLSQLRRLDEFVARRQEIARWYDGQLRDQPVTVPFQRPECTSAHHLYVIRLKLKEISRTHREVFEAMRSDNIGVNLHYIPIYRQPYYEALGFREGYCYEAERYYREAISLPIYPTLVTSELQKVMSALSRACAS